jgi:hypothetical protein
VQVTLRLQDASGFNIASDTLGNPGTRTVTQALAPGSYYILIRETAGYGNYTMAVN